MHIFRSFQSLSLQRQQKFLCLWVWSSFFVVIPFFIFFPRFLSIDDDVVPLVSIGMVSAGVTCLLSAIFSSKPQHSLLCFVFVSITSVLHGFVTLVVYGLTKSFHLRCRDDPDTCSDSRFLITFFIASAMYSFLLVPPLFISTSIHISTMPLPPWELADAKLDAKIEQCEESSHNFD
ncbi:hypothetical protein P9112_001051 [Eukaryota sp. TZLM1-RC]